MNPGKRVSTIKQIANRLGKREWADIDLILRQFGFTYSNDWPDGNRIHYVQHHVENGSAKELIALNAFLEDGPGDPRDASEGLPWPENRFRLFLSHVSGHKKFAAKLKVELEKLAINGFVAHEDIEPSKEWEVEIARALETCDALAALLTPEFHQSDWTDQEVGFCVGRRILVVPVTLGAMPYGFISKYQALRGKSLDEAGVAAKIFDILSKHDLTAERLSSAIVHHFAESHSFMKARANAALLDSVRAWTPDMLRHLEESSTRNSQIQGAWGVPERVKGILKQHSS